MKFIYFDLGNVFFTYDKVFTTVIKDFQIDINNLNQIIDGKYDAPATIGQMTIPEIWQKISTEFNLPNAENYNIIKSWVSDYDAIFPTHQLASDLISKYKIGVLSNNYFDFWPEDVSQGKVPDLNFSPIIISAEVGCKKPESKIYEIAEQKCGFSGPDIFFIDDKQENLDTAAVFGWQTFLFDYKNPRQSVSKLRSILL